MGSIGFSEILLIILLILILFGPEKLPELGKAIGKVLKELKKAEGELKNAFEESVRLESEDPLKNNQKDGERKHKENG